MHAIWTIALLLLAASGADKPALTAPSRVRSTEATARLLADTAAHSPTVRGLLERLAVTDTIVYVEMTTSPQIPTARTKFVTATPSARFLRIGINSALSYGQMAVLIAHELQHAVEIAEQEDVRDDEGVRHLFARIGYQHDFNSYETEAAKQVERRVREELQRRLPAS